MLNQGNKEEINGIFSKGGEPLNEKFNWIKRKFTQNIDWETYFQ